MPQVKNYTKEIEKLEVFDSAIESEAPILKAQNLERQKETAIADEIKRTEVIDKAAIDKAERRRTESEDFSQSDSDAFFPGREQREEIEKGLVLDGIEVPTNDDGSINLDELQKKKDQELKKKKVLALKMNLLKRPKKKPVVQRVQTTPAPKRVARTRNSNGTISVQNPTINLKSKGGGNGLDLNLNR